MRTEQVDFIGCMNAPVDFSVFSGLAWTLVLKLRGRLVGKIRVHRVVYLCHVSLGAFGAVLSLGEALLDGLLVPGPHAVLRLRFGPEGGELLVGTVLLGELVGVSGEGVEVQLGREGGGLGGPEVGERDVEGRGLGGLEDGLGVRVVVEGLVGCSVQGCFHQTSPLTLHPRPCPRLVRRLPLHQAQARHEQRARQAFFLLPVEHLFWPQIQLLQQLQRSLRALVYVYAPLHTI